MTHGLQNEHNQTLNKHTKANKPITAHPSHHHHDAHMIVVNETNNDNQPSGKKTSTTKHHKHKHKHKAQTPDTHHNVALKRHPIEHLPVAAGPVVAAVWGSEPAAKEMAQTRCKRERHHRTKTATLHADEMTTRHGGGASGMTYLTAGT
jgi:hypothetical protein